MELCYRNNKKSLFRKYARLITSLTKHQVFRDYVMDRNFRMPQKKLALLLPNGYHERLEKGVYRMTVSSRAVYAPRLYPALRVVDFFAGMYANLEEMQKALLYELEALKLFQNPFGYRYNHLRLRFLTLTVFPDPNPETTTVDGVIDNDVGGDNTWAVLVDAAAGTIAPDTNTVDTVVSASTTGTTDRYSGMTRGVFLFDTASLPNDAVLTANTSKFSLFGTGITDNLGQTVQLTTSDPASNTGLVTGDYAKAKFGTILRATGITIAAWSTVAYNDFTLNADGDALIIKTGVSKFGTRLSSDVSGVAPTWASVVNANASANFAEEAGTTKDPKLVVDYTEAPVLAGQSVFILQ